MSNVNLKLKEFRNWKEYFLDKFSDKTIFKIKQFDESDEHLENYLITARDSKCKTEIIFRILKENDTYKNIFDVYFNNPQSPKLSEDNKSNEYGFDGQGSSFNQANLLDLDDWVNIPIFRGWSEQTTFYNEIEIKTDCFWIQDGKTQEIPIKQNYLDNFGCLLFFLVPLNIFLMNRKLNKNPAKVRIDKKVIKPMVNISNHNNT